MVRSRHSADIGHFLDLSIRVTHLLEPRRELTECSSAAFLPAGCETFLDAAGL
ncbi:MAG: hypothetical protein II763_01300 [Bacteroidales bacterium]|nr:hypothetical protein [Bacteroidales bacterium]